MSHNNVRGSLIAGLIKGTVIFLAGFALAFFVDARFRNHGIFSANITEHRQGQYKLINPLLECDAAAEAITNPLGVSRFRIEDYINKQLDDKNADHISLYFRDLNNGPWMGIREKEEFIGGSLLKVPLMIAYLKEADDNPAVLNHKIFYGEVNPQVSLNQFFQPSKEIKPGNEYTVKEMIEYMIKYSDNNAADMLGKNIGPEKIMNVFLSLGLGLPEFNKPYPVNVRTYGSFFRILFNTSYLSDEMSEYALELLSEAEFSKGIVGDIPRDVTIAHKHGIREIDEESGKQLHDCGIVYYPNHPYLLCVMTRGDDFEKLSKIIRDISELIYKNVSDEPTGIDTPASRYMN